jgi:hypothetical protein
VLTELPWLMPARAVELLCSMLHRSPRQCRGPASAPHRKGSSGLAGCDSKSCVCVCVCVCGALLAALLSSAACVWQHRNELTAPLLRKICCDHWRVAMRPHHMHLLINIRARCVASAALHTHHNAANRVHSCPDTPITSQHIPPLCACARDNHTHCLSCIWMVLSCRALAARMMQPCYLPQAHRVVRGSMAVWAMACVLALWPV